MAKRFLTPYLFVFVLFGVLLAEPAKAQVGIVYVTENGAGVSNGSNWANALDKTRLQEAIAAANNFAVTNPGATAQVWVAGGTYKPNTPSDRNLTILLFNKVGVYGGFVGNETALAQRPDLSAAGARSTSILSGDIGVVGNPADNSYHVVGAENGDNSAILDGFVITGGNANGTDNGGLGAGVIFINASPTLRNCIIEYNSATGAGGGMGNFRGSSPTLTNCSFQHNSSPAGAGGALYNYASNPVLTSCTFQSNTASSGGAMYNYQNSPTLTNCIFQNNSSPASAGGGGALFNNTSNPVLTSCTFQSNPASSGGAMYNYQSSPTLTQCSFTSNSTTDLGGAMYNVSQSIPTLTNCSFTSNSATNLGGAIHNYQSSPVLTKCTFTSNTSTNQGGAIYNQTNSNPQLSNCTFQSNTTSSGGAISNNDNSSPSLTGCEFFSNSVTNLGGAIFNFNQSSPTLTQCTFQNNTTTYQGGAIFNFNQANPRLTNCFLYNNSAQYGGALFNESSSPVLINCLLTNNTASKDGGAVYQTAAGTGTLMNCTLSGNKANGGLGGGLTAVSSSTLAVTNSILWGNIPSQVGVSGATFTLRFSIIDQDGFDGQNGNLRTNPLFEPIALLGEQPLQACSPAINRGDNAAYNALSAPPTDLVGDARFFNNGTIDMGAQEYQAPLPLIRYVKAGGTGSGCSWATASGDLQAMIDLTGGQVWVAAGTYKPGGPANTNRNLSFRMKNGVSIYGGFVGNETALAQRPLLSGPSSSTLSGDLGVAGNPSDNSYHVIANPALNHSAVLDGFVISGGNAGTGYGGGLYGTEFESSPTVLNCYFTNNAGANGGAVSLYQSDALFTNCGFVNNVGSNGGAILVAGGSPSLVNCAFRTNSGGKGGGVYAINGNAQLINCLFYQNTSSSSGGGVYGEGSARVTLMNCSLSGNTSSTSNSGGAVSALGSSTLVMTNSILWGNTPSQAQVNPGATFTLQYSIIDQDGYAPQNNNLRADPRFANAATGDLSLLETSPAINKGNTAAYNTLNGPLTDLAGNARFVNNSVIDLGAYEFQGTPVAPVAILTQPPAASAACAGSTVTAAVSTSGTVTSYQWYRNGVAISGQTSATLTLANAQTATTGQYVVGITGAVNSLTSNAFFLQVSPSPQRLYVNAGATGSGDGMSWAGAFTILTDALNYGCPTNLTEVWVTSGLYKPTRTTNRTISFALRNGVAVYGGFTGSETSLAQRPLTYPSSTTLSGDIGTPGDPTDNAYHVFFNPNTLTNSAVLDGVVIRDGNANDATVPHNAGGGIYNNGEGGICSPTLRNCLFVSNLAASGAGVHNEGQNGTSSPRFINCAFVANTSTYGGGAIVNYGFQGVSSPQFVNCSWANNTAGTSGSVMYNIGDLGSSSPSLSNCVLFGNGGAKSFTNSQASTTVTYSLLETGVTSYSGSNNLTTATSPFVNASVGNLQLVAGSAAINAGNNSAYTSVGGPATDLAGHPRFQATTIDMGALELGSDLTPLLYARPSSLYGNSPFTVVVDVVETNGLTSSGLITLLITKEAHISLSLDPNLTTLNGRSVRNSSWSLDANSNAGYYVLRSSQAINAGQNLSVGLNGELQPGGTSGRLTISGLVGAGSGGDISPANNSIANKIEYFSQ